MSAEAYLLVYDNINMPSNQIQAGPTTQTSNWKESSFINETYSKHVLTNHNTNIPEPNRTKHDVMRSKWTQNNKHMKKSSSSNFETSDELFITSGSTLVASRGSSNYDVTGVYHDAENLTELKLRSEYGLFLKSSSMNGMNQHLFSPAYTRQHNDNNNNNNNSDEGEIGFSLAVNNSLQYEYEAEIIPPTSLQPITQQPTNNDTR